MGSPELSGKRKGRENEVHSAITYRIQTPGKAANFPACSSTAWKHRTHARHEEPQRGSLPPGCAKSSSRQAARGACRGGLSCPCPSHPPARPVPFCPVPLPVPFPSLAAPQPSEQHAEILSSSPGSCSWHRTHGVEACGEWHRGHAQLFLRVSLFCSSSLHLFMVLYQS